jgi:hypothetical protein
VIQQTFINIDTGTPLLPKPLLTPTAAMAAACQPNNKNKNKKMINQLIKLNPELSKGRKENKAQTMMIEEA